jgi:hypothetical protein
MNVSEVYKKVKDEITGKNKKRFNLGIVLKIGHKIIFHYTDSLINHAVIINIGSPITM